MDVFDKAASDIMATTRSHRSAKIKIKKANRGKLHQQLGVPQGKKIPVSSLEAAKRSSDPAERKRANFALNARKWNHG